MIAWHSKLSHLANPRASKEAEYPTELEAILSMADAEKTYAEISPWPGYEATQLDEGSVGPCMRLLASGAYGDRKVIAGESAVAGLAALIAASQSGEMTQNLGLDNQSRVLIIGTEGATDPDRPW